ncbi:HAMP domain-containing histidine kinase [Patescibacteria group bacterium]|nr:HAMP domain-containing histidine kinase [Patescibacteria group bacterium]MBU2473064.1 HAMP domain-containing histidine kinase [Patescibacteria group bacterium]
MPIKKIFKELNFVEQCKKNSLTLWECPSFLFLIISFITILAILSTYIITVKYTQPEIVALIVIGVTAILFIINYLIVQGSEKLAQINQMKTEFVNIASHQLRAPLTGIKWAINLMDSNQAEKLTKEQSERLQIIKENNQRMINLVNDLLNLSRIEQGKLGLTPEKISLDKITRKIIKEHSLIAKANNTELFLDSEPNLPLISINSQGMELVLNNMIDNAIRYTKKSGTVKIKLSKKNSSVRCEIEDNGVGIPKGDQNKIFQKFFRSQNIMKYQTEGTGLGLFIAKAVIKNAKGQIGFFSKENKGTIFWFEIPIK